MEAETDLTPWSSCHRIERDMADFRFDSVMETLAEILRFPADSIAAFLDFALERTVKLSGSRFGYIYHYDEESREFVLNTWSKEVMAECAVAEPAVRYRLENTGLWGEAVRQRRPIVVNDFQSFHPEKRGVPEGHVPILRFMTLPVFRGDRIVGVIGLANKGSDYGEADLQTVSVLMEAVWKVTEKIRSEEAVREHEELHRSILKTAMDGFWLADLDGRIAEVNETYCRMSGYDERELVGMEISRLDAAKTPEEIAEKIRAIVSSGEGRFETRHRRKDGSEFDVEASVQYRAADCGRLVLFFRDISEKKRSAEALHESEEKCRRLVRDIQVGVLLLNANFDIVMVNPKASELLGLAGEDLKDASVFSPRWDLIGEDGSPLLEGARSFETALRSGNPIREASVGLRRPDGSRIWLSLDVEPQLRDDGSVRQIVCTLVDISEIKRAEDAKRKTDAMLRTLSVAIDQSPVTTVLTDAQGSIEFVNPKFTQTTGYSAAEAIGQNPRILKSGELPASEYADLWKTIRAGRNWHGLFHNRKKNGGLYWESAVISPVKDENGEISHFLALKEDITEKKLMEEKLLLQAQAMDSASGYIIIADALAEDFPVIYVNAAFQRITGYSAEETIGRNCRFLQGEERNQTGLEEIRAGMREGRPCKAQLRNYRKDGSLYWNDINIAPVRDGQGRVTHFIGISNDVTEFLRIQAELLDNEQRLRIAQEYANIGTWDLDLMTGKLFWSERIAPLFGYPEGELETTYGNFLNAVHPDDRELLSAAVADCIEKGTLYRIEHRCVWPDGTVRWLLETGNVTRDSSGAPQRMLGLVQDVTARKQAEFDLIRSREEAQRANRAKSEFLSLMSHELRTPLNAILGFGQLLEMDAALDATQSDYVREMTAAGRHLLALINEVLDLSRIETGRMDLSKERTDCAALVRECIALVEPLAVARGIRLEQGRFPDAAVLADHVRLKQVLMNLLSNAVKYNRPAGLVAVEVETADGAVRISVRDEGRGIPADRLDELFVPFNRLGAEKSEIEGTGIGLTISKRLIELMDGRIGVESEMGVGSRFWIEVPLAEGRNLKAGGEPGPAAVRPSAPSAGNRTVLHIEDDLANLRLVGKILALRPDLRLISVRSASEGLAAAAAEAPDLILLDVNMPEADGYEVLRRLRASDGGRDVPVIAVTAAAMPHDIERGIAAGFSEYLTKPLEVTAFLAAVDRGLMSPL